MKANLLWFLPSGDGRFLGSDESARKVDLNYLIQVAKAAEYNGFEGVLIPTGMACIDPYLIASALITQTSTLKFLVALRPGIISPTLSARVAADLDALSKGRALFNLVAGASTAELEADGIWLNHDERYHQAFEFTEIWQRLLKGENVSFEGQYYKIKNAKLERLSLQNPYPPLYFGGSSDIALDLAGKFVDKYLSWGEPPALLKEKIDKVKEHARKYGREVSFGVRLHIIVREDEDEAWSVANKLISRLDEATIKAAQEYIAKDYESVGQARMSELLKAAREKGNLEIYPHLWAGIGLVRRHAATALVGSAKNVLKLMREYLAIGVDTFVLSGYPHLEESFYVGELIAPHFERLETASAFRQDLNNIGRDSISENGICNGIVREKAAHAEKV